MNPMTIIQAFVALMVVIGFAFVLVVPIFWPEAKLDPSMVQDIKDAMKLLIGFFGGGVAHTFLNRQKDSE